MVYSIDSTHLNNGHMYPTHLRIIPEWLSQIYIVAHRWKEEIFSFPTMCHSSKSVTSRDAAVFCTQPRVKMICNC